MSVQPYADLVRHDTDERLAERCLESCRRLLAGGAHDRDEEYPYALVLQDECRKRGRNDIWQTAARQAKRERRREETQP